MRVVEEGSGRGVSWLEAEFWARVYLVELRMVNLDGSLEG